MVVSAAEKNKTENRVASVRGRAAVLNGRGLTKKMNDWNKDLERMRAPRWNTYMGSAACAEGHQLSKGTCHLAVVNLEGWTPC